MNTTKYLLKKFTCLVLAILMVVAVHAATPKTLHKTVMSGRANTFNTQTKLLLNIAIEDFRYDYLQILQSGLQPGGFSMMINDGVTFSNVDFGTPLDFESSLAILATGASPSINGIPAKKYYDRESKRPVNILTDATIMGNFTDETYSPSEISTTTMNDEIRIAGDGVTYSYSIAPSAMPAIIQAGHTGNSAVWLNGKTGNWATTTYYKDFPNAATGRNRLTPLSQKLDTMQWAPLYKQDKYPMLPDHLTHYPFRYVFPKNASDRFAQFANSPMLNREITDLAIDYIKQLQLGSHDGIDVLSLVYSLKPFEFSKKADVRYELMDSYYRLDADLARLFSCIDKTVGIDNVVICIVSTPQSREQKRDDEKWRLPFGQFSTKKAISLLNMYLMAIHGNGEWVQGFHNGYFYLNDKLAGEKNVDMLTLRKQSAEFLSKMSGVYNVHTIDNIITGSAGEHSAALKRNTSPKYSGDLLVSILPGWQLLDDSNGYVNPAQIGVQRAVPPTSVVMIKGADATPGVVTTKVDARSIAPTVAKLIKVRPPSAAIMPSEL